MNRKMKKDHYYVPRTGWRDPILIAVMIVTITLVPIAAIHDYRVSKQEKKEYVQTCE